MLPNFLGNGNGNGNGNLGLKDFALLISPPALNWKSMLHSLTHSFLLIELNIHADH